MASVRQRSYTYQGVTKLVWCCDFTDELGRRKMWTPKSGLKSDAEAFRRSAERTLAKADIVKAVARYFGDGAFSVRAEECIALPLLYGAPAIAAFLGVPEPAARELAKHGYVTTFRLGAEICALRSTLRAELAALDDAARDAAETARAKAAKTAAAEALVLRARARARSGGRSVDPAELAGVETRRSQGRRGR